MQKRSKQKGLQEKEANADSAAGTCAPPETGIHSEALEKRPENSQQPVQSANADGGSSNIALHGGWGDSDAGMVTYNGGSWDFAEAITIDSSNNTYVAGYSYNGSNNDLIVRKYDANGDLATGWGDNDSGTVTYDSGNGADYAYAITIDSSNNIYVAGYSENGSGEDLIVRKYDAGGDLAIGEGSGVAVTDNDSTVAGVTVAPLGQNRSRQAAALSKPRPVSGKAKSQLTKMFSRAKSMPADMYKGMQKGLQDRVAAIDQAARTFAAPQTGIYFEALEPRMLLSGGVDAVIIDNQLENSEQLFQSAVEAEYVVVYDGSNTSAKDVIQDLTQAAASSQQKIDSISILSHGSSG